MGLAALSSSFLIAQSITSANFTRPGNFVDSVSGALPSSVSAATPGAGQTWDYSNLISVPALLLLEEYRSSRDSTVGYPATIEWSDRMIQGFAATGPSAEFRNLNNTGYYAAAYHTNRLVEPLTAVTGNPTDELVVLQQRIVYPDTLFYLKFPVTAQSSWVSTRTRDIQFNITAAAANLNQTPGFFRQISVDTRIVIGSGQIIIPDENGNPMPPVDVFLIESILTDTDSIFLNGAPAPAALLANFGLSQGDVSLSRVYLFYPSNGGESAVASYNTDAQNSITSFEYRPRAARKALSVGLNENRLATTTLYPNPLLAGQRLTIEHDTPAEVAQVKIYSVQGAYLAAYKAEAIHNDAVTFTPQLAAGLYLVNLVGAEGAVLSSTKLQVQ